MITQNFFNPENPPIIQTESDDANLVSENFASVFAGISNNSQNPDLLSEKSLCPDLSQTPQQNDVVCGINQDQFDVVTKNQFSNLPNSLHNSEIISKETFANPLNIKKILPDNLNDSINFPPAFINKSISIEETLANFWDSQNQLNNQVTGPSTIVTEANILKVSEDADSLKQLNQLENSLTNNSKLIGTSDEQTQQFQENNLKPLISENQFNKSSNCLKIPADLTKINDKQEFDGSPKSKDFTLISTTIADPQTQIFKGGESSNELSIAQSNSLGKKFLPNENSKADSFLLNQPSQSTDYNKTLDLTELGEKTSINQSNNSAKNKLDILSTVGFQTPNTQEKGLNSLTSVNQFNKSADGLIPTPDLSELSDDRNSGENELDISPQFIQSNIISTPIITTPNQVSKDNESSTDLSAIQVVSDKQIFANDNSAVVSPLKTQKNKLNDSKENFDLTELNQKMPINNISEKGEITEIEENTAFNPKHLETENQQNQILQINNENSSLSDIETTTLSDEVKADSKINLDRISKAETKTRSKVKTNKLETLIEDAPTFARKINSNIEQTNLSSITENTTNSSTKTEIREEIKSENIVKNDLISDVQPETAPNETKQTVINSRVTDKTPVEVVNPTDSTVITEEKPSFEPKLPKLFREVSEIFAVEDKKVANSQKTTEVVLAEEIKQKEIIEQIKPKILEFAQLTNKKSEPQILRMRLRPAELGTIEVKLEKNANGTLNAYLKTETESARQTLAGNLEQLREALQNSGWQVGKLELSGNSFLSNGNESRENPSRQFEMAENQTSPGSFSQNSTITDSSEEISGNRLVNLRA